MMQREYTLMNGVHFSEQNVNKIALFLFFLSPLSFFCFSFSFSFSLRSVVLSIQSTFLALIFAFALMRILTHSMLPPYTAPWRAVCWKRSNKFSLFNPLIPTESFSQNALISNSLHLCRALTASIPLKILSLSLLFSSKFRSCTVPTDKENKEEEM